ncbi:unnamed protein product [Protopolystoma xenopodis]|uniref:Uncharacterized protein n=1 Tax=Protopolystoma xenopodis TaxID=117903 RepID=A0A3S5A7Q7_9PLAT|nr:unnamed protein product [Protopolystoma xenopodis]
MSGGDQRTEGNSILGTDEKSRRHKDVHTIEARKGLSSSPSSPSASASSFFTSPRSFVVPSSNHTEAMRNTYSGFLASSLTSDETEKEKGNWNSADSGSYWLMNLDAWLTVCLVCASSVLLISVTCLVYLCRPRRVTTIGIPSTTPPAPTLPVPDLPAQPPSSPMETRVWTVELGDGSEGGGRRGGENENSEGVQFGTTAIWLKRDEEDLRQPNEISKSPTMEQESQTISNFPTDVRQCVRLLFVHSPVPKSQLNQTVPGACPFDSPAPLKYGTPVTHDTLDGRGFGVRAVRPACQAPVAVQLPSSINKDYSNSSNSSINNNRATSANTASCSSFTSTGGTVSSCLSAPSTSPPAVPAHPETSDPEPGELANLPASRGVYLGAYSPPFLQLACFDSLEVHKSPLLPSEGLESSATSSLVPIISSITPLPAENGESLVRLISPQEAHTPTTITADHAQPPCIQCHLISSLE